MWLPGGGREGVRAFPSLGAGSALLPPGTNGRGSDLPSNPGLEAKGQRVTLRPKGLQRRNAHEMSARFPHLASQTAWLLMLSFVLFLNFCPSPMHWPQDPD